MDKPALDLAMVAEIAELLGLTTQRIDQLSREDPTFPEAVAEVRAGRIWDRQDVEEWARETGRLR